MFGLIATILTIAASVGGLIFVRRKVHLDTLKLNHDVADPLLSVVGTLFAVLLGLMVANAMQRFEEARITVQQEASAVGNIYRASAGLPDDMRDRIQKSCKTYVEIVIDDEWPKLAHQHTSDTAWKAYNEIWLEAVHFVPANNGQTNLQQSILGYLGVLGDMRRTRIGALCNGLPDILWFVLLLGGAATICFTYLFGIDNLKFQVFMTSMVSLAICLNLFLLASFQYPFEGDIMVRPTAFLNLRSNIQAIEHPGRPYLQ